MISFHVPPYKHSLCQHMYLKEFSVGKEVKKGQGYLLTCAFQWPRGCRADGERKGSLAGVRACRLGKDLIVERFADFRRQRKRLGRSRDCGVPKLITVSGVIIKTQTNRNFIESSTAITPFHITLTSISRSCFSPESTRFEKS